METLLMRNQGIIYALLKKYNIKYEVDEYAQLLFIKMWMLIQQFDMSIHHSMSGYLFQRLNYYLIDLFRKNSKYKENYIQDVSAFDQNIHQTTTLNNWSQMVLADFYVLLNDGERMWLNLKLCGYKQFEIQSLMEKSATTIRKYQTQVRHKLAPFKSYLKEALTL